MKYFLTLLILIVIAGAAGDFYRFLESDAMEKEHRRIERTERLNKQIRHNCNLAFPKSRAMQESCVRQAQGEEM